MLQMPRKLEKSSVEIFSLYTVKNNGGKYENNLFWNCSQIRLRTSADDLQPAIDRWKPIFSCVFNRVAEYEGVHLLF